MPEKPLLIRSLAVIIPFLLSPVFSQTLEQDSLALVELYNSTDGPNWKWANNWLTDNPCNTWANVTVSDGRVTGLTLTDNRMTGAIQGSIGNLTGLINLDLRKNNLSGSIPSGIGSCMNLKYLYLDYNQLSGPIPPEIGGLTELTELIINYNQLTGPIPSEIGLLTKLTRISLFQNKLSGPIPPEIGSLVNLEFITIDRNQLSGPIPSEIGLLSRLSFFSFGNNQLSGEIPPEIGSLSELTLIIGKNNQLSGTLPPELGSLKKLCLMCLDTNQLTGEIPSEFGSLETMYNLSVKNNMLSGSLPPELGSMKNLSTLEFSCNKLSGEIPSELGLLKDLYFLDLSCNQLTGSVPHEIGEMSSLEDLLLAENQLVDLPNLSAMHTLVDVAIENNRFTFEDIVPNKNIGINFTYAPQDSVGVGGNTVVDAGKDFTLSISVAGQGNRYQWMKDGQAVPGGTGDVLKIEKITPADSGSYNCHITNTFVTDLTLFSRPLVVKVNDDVAIESTDTIPSGQSDFAVVPNPVPVDAPSVRFVIPFVRGGSAYLTVYDAMGTVVYSDVVPIIPDTKTDSGSLYRIWDLTNIQRRKVACGAYKVFLKITDAGGRIHEYTAMMGIACSFNE